MRKTAKVPMLLLFFVCMIRPGLAQEDANSLFDAMFAQFHKLKSFSASYRVTDYTTFQRFDAELNIENPDKIRGALHYPGYDYLEVINGKVCWKYNSRQKKARKFCKRQDIPLACGLFPADASGGLPVHFYGVEAFHGIECNVLGLDISSIQKASLDKTNDEFIPAVYKARYWFSKDQGIPLKIETYDEKGRIIMESYVPDHSYTTNAAIPKERFEFIPPGDVKVIDYCKG